MTDKRGYRRRLIEDGRLLVHSHVLRTIGAIKDPSKARTAAIYRIAAIRTGKDTKDLVEPIAESRGVGVGTLQGQISALLAKGVASERVLDLADEAFGPTRDIIPGVVRNPTAWDDAPHSIVGTAVVDDPARERLLGLVVDAPEWALDRIAEALR